MSRKRGGVAQHAQDARAFEDTVIGKLALPGGIGDLLLPEVDERTAFWLGPREDGSEADSDLTLPHFGKGDRSRGTSLFGRAFFGGPYGGDRQRQVAIPVH